MAVDSVFHGNESFHLCLVAQPKSRLLHTWDGGSRSVLSQQSWRPSYTKSGFHLGTPLSLPHVEGRSNVATTFDMHSFQPGFLDSHGFQAPDPFGLQPTFAPSSFHHQDSGFDTMSASNANTPGQQTIVGSVMSQNMNIGAFPQRSVDRNVSDSTFPSSNKLVAPCSCPFTLC